MHPCEASHALAHINAELTPLVATYESRKALRPSLVLGMTASHMAILDHGPMRGQGIPIDLARAGIDEHWPLAASARHHTGTSTTHVTTEYDATATL